MCVHTKITDYINYYLLTKDIYIYFRRVASRNEILLCILLIIMLSKMNTPIRLKVLIIAMQSRKSFHFLAFNSNNSHMI